MYTAMSDKDTRLRRSMPYCLFQHYCAEILNTTIIERSISLNQDIRFEQDRRPFDVIGMSELRVPKPFALWLSNINSVVMQNGDVIYLNLPDAAIPQYQGEGISSGSFGEANVANHNAYECYVSPLITKRLVERTLEATQHHALVGVGWNPLPEGFFPAGCTPTVNLLGYQLPEALQNESMNALMGLNFADDESMAGRLCHCPELMTRVNGVLEIQDHFNFQIGAVGPAVNPAGTIYAQVTEAVQNVAQLSDRHGSLHSVECFGSSAANMSVYFGYKRKRANRAFGPC